MKLNMQHAKEFSRILQKPELEPQSMDSDGNFCFTLKGAETNSDKKIDPGIIASLIHLKKSVERGQSPEQQLEASIVQICKELKL